MMESLRSIIILKSKKYINSSFVIYFRPEPLNPAYGPGGTPERLIFTIFATASM
jgi:hypothetical protein